MYVDPDLSTEQLIENSRKQSQEERKAVTEELQQIDAGIKLKCDYLRQNPQMCTLDALGLVIGIINSGKYSFGLFEVGSEYSIMTVSCFLNGKHIMPVTGICDNIVWVVEEYNRLLGVRDRKNELDEFIAKISAPATEVTATEEFMQQEPEVDVPLDNKKLGRDPIRWLFRELQRTGDIKREEDTVLIRRISELTGHSYKKMYEHKNEELTGLAKRRMIVFFEELIEKLNE